MSPSGEVSSLWVNPVPGPLVLPVTRFAPTIRSDAFVVVAAPLLLVALVPVAAAVTSTGVDVLMPEYSRMRISGKAAEGEKATVTALAPAAAALMPEE